MNRIVALCLVLVLALGFTACDTTDSSVSIRPASTADSDSTGLKTVLDDIGTLPVATMGVSLMAAAKAVDLLEWCTKTAMTAEQITDEVTAYIETIAEENRPMYIEQLLTVTSSAESMKEDSYREYMLMDIGYDPEGYDWDEATFAKLAAVAEAVSAYGN